MNRPRKSISDQELDAALASHPLRPRDSFLERTLLKVAPVTEQELEALLSSGPLITQDFTARTLERIYERDNPRLIDFPYRSWLAKAGIAVAVLLVSAISWSIWQNQNAPAEEHRLAQADFSAMNYEELLFVEETLSSAKVLIELEKTVPLYVFLDEAGS